MIKKFKSKFSKARDAKTGPSSGGPSQSPSASTPGTRDEHINQLIMQHMKEGTVLGNTIALLDSLGVHSKPRERVVKEFDMNDLKPYRYGPLPTETSFRLLEFTMDEIDFPLGFGDQKVCRLVTYERTKAPPYLCLSYTWGHPVEKQELREAYKKMETWVLAPGTGKDGEWTSIPVGQNLFRAMKQIFKSKSSIPYIWIDALCINQDDIEEKQIQLTAMGDIYAQSVRTLVWLGEGTIFDQELARFFILHLTVPPAVEAYSQKNGVQSLSEGWDEDNFYKRLGLSKGDCDWKGYRKFYKERTYFDRTWVIQEVAFSKELLVMVAHHVMDFKDMSFMARFLRISGLDNHFLFFDTENDDDEPKQSHQVAASPLIDPWSQIQREIVGIGSMEWLTKFATGNEVDDLETAAYMFFSYILGTMRFGDATEPKDKIFAAFSFLQQALKPLGIPPRIPAYTKSVGEIYNEIAAIFLEILPDFAVLSEAQYPYPRRIEGLATWVPDYSFRQHQSLYARDRYTRYNAGGAPTKRAKPDEALYTITRRPASPFLTLHQCYLLDTISHTLERPPPEAVSRNDWGKITSYQRFILEEWKLLMSHLRPTVTSPKNEHHDWQTLFVTILANQLDAENRIPILPIHFKKYMLLCYLIRRRLFEKMCKSGSLTQEEIAVISEGWMNDTEHTWAEDAKRYPELIPSWAEMTEYWETWNEAKYTLSETAALESIRQQNVESTVFIDASARFEAGKTLFATQGGRLGLGPEKMLVGDQILLIKGARMAYVVRKFEGGEAWSLYSLIGECYVHSVMNGEMLEEIERCGWSSINVA